jgi:hypothetical protein
VMLPYLLTIVALAVTVARVRQPAALNKPFERGESWVKPLHRSSNLCKGSKKNISGGKDENPKSVVRSSDGRAVRKFQNLNHPKIW